MSAPTIDLSTVIPLWRPVVGWEDFYEVSDQGDVRSLRTGKLATLTSHSSGYQVVGFADGSRKEIRHVHRVVLDAFIGPLPDGMVSCHGPGGKTDNRIANLRYDTSSANNYDTVRDGNHHFAARTHCDYGHEFTPDNTLVRSDGGRKCRTCHRYRNRINARRYRANKKVKESVQ